MAHGAFTIRAPVKTVSRLSGLRFYSRIVTVQSSCACGQLHLRCPFPFEHLQITPEIINSSMIAALLSVATGSETKWELMSECL